MQTGNETLIKKSAKNTKRLLKVNLKGYSHALNRKKPVSVFSPYDSPFDLLYSYRLEVTYSIFKMTAL
jgi:hypothetical protein